MVKVQKPEPKTLIKGKKVEGIAKKKPTAAEKGKNKAVVLAASAAAETLKKEKKVGKKSVEAAINKVDNKKATKPEKPAKAEQKPAKKPLILAPPESPGAPVVKKAKKEEKAVKAKKVAPVETPAVEKEVGAKKAKKVKQQEPVEEPLTPPAKKTVKQPKSNKAKQAETVEAPVAPVKEVEAKKATKPSKPVKGKQEEPVEAPVKANKKSKQAPLKAAPATPVKANKKAKQTPTEKTPSTPAKPVKKAKQTQPEEAAAAPAKSVKKVKQAPPAEAPVAPSAPVKPGKKAKEATTAPVEAPTKKEAIKKTTKSAKEAPTKEATTEDKTAAAKVKKDKYKKKREVKKVPVELTYEIKSFDEQKFHDIVCQSNIQKVVTALKTQVAAEVEKKKTQSIFSDYRYVLQVSSYKISSCPKRMVKPSLKHSLVSTDDDVALIVTDLKRGAKFEVEPTIQHYEDLLREAGVEQRLKIIPFNQLRNEMGTFEAKRKFVNTYDYLLCDGRLAGQATGFLGKFTQKPRNVLHSVRLSKAGHLKAEISRALSRTAFRQLAKGDLVAMPVGNHEHSPKQVTENILHVVEQFPKLYAGGLSNIRTIYLKIDIAGTSSLPLYISTMAAPEDAPYVVGPKEQRMLKLKKSANEVLARFALTKDADFIKLTPDQVNKKREVREKRLALQAADKKDKEETEDGPVPAKKARKEKAAAAAEADEESEEENEAEDAEGDDVDSDEIDSDEDDAESNDEDDDEDDDEEEEE